MRARSQIRDEFTFLEVIHRQQVNRNAISDEGLCSHSQVTGTVDRSIVTPLLTHTPHYNIRLQLCTTSLLNNGSEKSQKICS